MKEGTAPVPPYCPCSESDDGLLPFRGYRIFGGAQSGGGETPMSVQVF